MLVTIERNLTLGETFDATAILTGRRNAYTTLILM